MHLERQGDLAIAQSVALSLPPQGRAFTVRLLCTRSWRVVSRFQTL